MINTQVYIDNIKNYMESLSWASPAGSGTTSFTSVYTAPTWVNENGFPFLVILDEPQGTLQEFQTTFDDQFASNLAFYICANWSVNAESTEADQREEAMLRVREAYDALREVLVDDSIIAGWLSSPTDATRGPSSDLTWRSESITVEDDYITDDKLIRRTIRLPISDIINNT